MAEMQQDAGIDTYDKNLSIFVVSSEIKILVLWFTHIIHHAHPLKTEAFTAPR